ncbi:hypothetical protein IIC_04802 [Bacillus cereus VD021]|uniref:DUF1173 family protein n=1 Tax=Bacillus cereus VD021 TaxID=1053224 RepID=R8HBW8_BACCE|nr:hypothetical protein [Bacillus cereus]EOO70360.1 hypothetical protein IIC_04802 [Bacillus cereus VD021]
MGTYLKKISTVTNEIKYMSYEWIEEILNNDEKNRLLSSLKRQLLAKEIELFCTCSTKNIIQMSIRKGQKNYSIMTFRNQKELHEAHCNQFNDNYICHNNYIQNWREQKNGTIIVNLNIPSTKTSNINEEDNKKEDTSQKKEKQFKKNGASTSPLTVYELTRKLLIQAWDLHIWNLYTYKKQNAYPNLAEVWHNLIFTGTKKIILNKQNLTLHDITSTTGQEKSIYAIQKKHNFNLPAYFILEFVAAEEIDADTHHISARNPKTKEIFIYEIETQLLNDILNSTNVKEGPYIIAGYAKANSYGKKPIILGIAIVPINTYGVVIESSYERSLYNILCSEGRLVQRIHDYKYHPQWEGMLPDGLLLDTDKPTILEVFGMSKNVTSYHVRKEAKISHFNSLEEYNFWFWNAFENPNNMLNIPAKNQLLKETNI